MSIYEFVQLPMKMVQNTYIKFCSFDYAPIGQGAIYSRKWSFFIDWIEIFWKFTQKELEEGILYILKYKRLRGLSWIEYLGCYRVIFVSIFLPKVIQIYSVSQISSFPITCAVKSVELGWGSFVKKEVLNEMK